MKKYILIVSICIFAFCNQMVFAKDFTVHKLQNGQMLIVKEVHDNPIVTIDTWIRTGSINETDKNNGVAHFLEHMFFKGTQKYPAGKFDQILESKGAITNAATSKDYTHYYIILPSKDFVLAMEMHSDMLLNPILPRNELEMERKVILEEQARINDSIDRTIHKNLVGLMYKEHPYKREIIGTKDVIETITKEEMDSFYETWYKPNNMITVVAGDVDTNRVVKLVEKNFGTNKNSKAPKIEYRKEPIHTKQAPYVQNLDTETGYVLFGFRGVSSKDKQTSAILDVIATILGDGKSSRLYQQVQDKKHLCSSIYAANSSSKDDSVLVIKANFNPQNQEQLEKAIWLEIEKLKRNEVSQEELKKAKNIIKVETAYSRESVSNIANELGYTTLIVDNPRYYDLYLKDVAKVSAKDIKKVANEYLQRDKVAISYVMPKNTQIIKNKKISFTNEELKSNYTEQSKIKTNNEYPINNNSKLVSEYKNIKKYILDNGLTLIVSKNEANNIVAVNMLSKGGYFNESKRATGLLTADLITHGTKNYSASELNNLLEEKGIELSASMGSDAFSVSMKMTVDEMKTAFNLFDEVINNASLDENELIKIKEKKIQNIKASRDLPSNVAFDEIKYMLWADTPYQSSSKVIEKAIPVVSTKDIREFYSKTFAPQNTIVSINGDVDEQLVINYFSDVFKNKKDKDFDYKKFEKSVYPISQNRDSIISKNTNQAWVILAYRTPKLTSNKDWATLKVIDTILGSGMSSRLFSRLRDQQGLAYVVGSSYQTNILGGVFATYIGTKPENAEITKEKMAEQLDKLTKSFVSSTELSNAKEQIWGNYIISQETNAAKAHTIAKFENTGKGFDFEKDYFKYINEVTEQDIIEMANRIFTTPVVSVTVK